MAHHSSNNECGEIEPLEKRKIIIEKDGIKKHVAALHIGWVEERPYVSYIPPPVPQEDGSFVLGAKEDWLERMEYIQDDLDWLLHLPQHSFWSQFLFGNATTNILTSYLQEAPHSFNDYNIPDDEEMKQSLQLVHRLVFLVYVRLATPKESKTDFISPAAHADLIYDNYLLDIPTIMDLCVIYGYENRSLLSKMITHIFRQQPKYENDTEAMVSYLPKALQTMEEQIDSLKPSSAKLTAILKDVILYVLDTAGTLSAFLEVYPPIALVFHAQSFELKIATFYENSIPELFRKVERLSSNAEDESPVQKDLKHWIDVARVEFINAFRLILSSSINFLVEKPNESAEGGRKEVDEYLNLLGDCLSEKTFICDYHSKYHVDADFDMIGQIYPDLYTEKCEFIFEAILAYYNDPIENKKRTKSVKHKVNSIQNQTSEAKVNGSSQVASGGDNAELEGAAVSAKLTGVQLESLITEVKDIFPDLGDGFLEHCLEYYNYKSENVINAVLEDTLPEKLKGLDRHMAKDKKDKELQNGYVPRLNVFDGDEFDVMTRDNIDTSRIHRGKKKPKHKTVNDLLDDKADLEGLRDMYSKYGTIDTEGSMYDKWEYDDEFDDTYEGLDVSVGEPSEPGEEQSIRRLNAKWRSVAEESSDEEEEDAATENKSKDAFIQNPAVLRERAEQRRQQKWENQNRKKCSAPPRDLVGKAKGQGQEKNVQVNRQHKEAHKSSRGNHNRKNFSNRKRAQGMIPS